MTYRLFNEKQSLNDFRVSVKEQSTPEGGTAKPIVAAGEQVCARWALVRSCTAIVWVAVSDRPYGRFQWFVSTVQLRHKIPQHELPVGTRFAQRK